MLKTAVIGVGYLGRFHAQKHTALPECELVGVVDSNPEQARTVGEELGVPWHTEPDAVWDQVEAVSIVVPTCAHHSITKPFLERGIHVLLEKPFAASIVEAEALTTLAEAKGTVLQIGHLERFNVVYTGFREHIGKPQFVESIRIAPFPKRGTDVDVILDLMIHDIDLVLAVVQEMPEAVEATGVPILTTSIDLASARLRFPGGCMANLTASRVSDKAERRMRIFQSGLYLSLDYGTGQARRLQVNPQKFIDPETLHPETFQFERGDALLEEVRSFLDCVRTGNAPQVSAQDGLNAMRVAAQVQEQIGH